MDKSSAQTPSGLEDQLRSMILNNVTITNDVSAPPRNPPRGQRRGGSAPNPQRHQNRNVRPTNTIEAPAPHTRGGSLEGPWRHSGSAPFPSPTPQSSNQQKQRQRSNGQQTASAPKANRGGQQWTPKKPQTQQSTQPVARELATFGVHVEPPQILRRPQGLHSPPLQSSPGLPSPRQNFRPNPQRHENSEAQCQYLDQVAAAEVQKVEMTSDEQSLKEAFRVKVESICQLALKEGYSGDLSSIELRCFGSLSSGFATKGSDVDLAVVPSWNMSSKASSGARVIDRDIPRLFEKKLLESGYGARLLTRTRVPILKVCELPFPELFTALCEERQKWDELPEEEKYPPPPTPGIPASPSSAQDKSNGKSGNKQGPPAKGTKPNPKGESIDATKASEHSKDAAKANTSPRDRSASQSSEPTDDKGTNPNAPPQRRHEGPWLREKVLGPLDFPKTGVGIQSDINFENPLALHNTALLRCYCLCDPRIRPMVLFVKAWAKRRKINSSYSGTLSSYGYVLMVLHYVVNIAKPPVCPNLQLCWNPSQENADPAKALADTLINGYEIRFWRDEAAIKRDAARGILSANRQPLGALLCGFFQYYASGGYGMRSFNWVGEVLSLRTPGGIRTKQTKGWTGAKSTVMDGREVRHRYLFAIEDPFEWDHNVARTVTHHGIVAIRDEFRRALRILGQVGRGLPPEGELFEAVVEVHPEAMPASNLGVGTWASQAEEAKTAEVAPPPPAW